MDQAEALDALVRVHTDAAVGAATDARDAHSPPPSLHGGHAAVTSPPAPADDGGSAADLGADLAGVPVSPNTSSTADTDNDRSAEEPGNARAHVCPPPT